MLTNEALAEAVPLACGVKVTVKTLFCPAAMVKGNNSPLTTYSGVLALPEDTVTLPLVALSVPLKVELVPTVTLPKLSVEGETDSCPAAVPVPDRDTVRLGFEASDKTEMLPLNGPAVLGAKIVEKVKF